jgi:hypothetical protein
MPAPSYPYLKVLLGGCVTGLIEHAEMLLSRPKAISLLFGDAERAVVGTSAGT